MPRGPRLDAPDSLHHVIARGIERCDIFRDDRDRNDFLERLGAACRRCGSSIYAWSLLTNHVHLLVRSGAESLSSFMRRLLGGYAVVFNRRHRRSGHLFQNRFKSILVEDEPYFLTLVRYIHLNPLRAGIVRTMDSLESYPWSGHAGLIGRYVQPWQDTEAVLEQFGAGPHDARASYRRFMLLGVEGSEPIDLDGGGLRRSIGGWERVERLLRGRERWSFDERILGTGDFVRSVLEKSDPRGLTPPPRPGEVLPCLLGRVARRVDVAEPEIRSASRRRPAPMARALVSYMAVRHFGLTVSATARYLHVSPQSVLRGIDRAPGVLRRLGCTAAELAGRR